MKVCSSSGVCVRSVTSNSLRSHGLYSARLLCSWDFPEYWSGWPFPSTGDLPEPGIEPEFLWQVDSLMLRHLGSPFTLESKVKVVTGHSSLALLFVISWTVARQTPLSMGFSRQEYWSGLPFPSPEDLPDPGIKPGFPALQADSLLYEPSACTQN